MLKPEEISRQVEAKSLFFRVADQIAMGDPRILFSEQTIYHALKVLDVIFRPFEADPFWALSTNGLESYYTLRNEKPELNFPMNGYLNWFLEQVDLSAASFQAKIDSIFAEKKVVRSANEPDESVKTRAVNLAVQDKDLLLQIPFSNEELTQDVSVQKFQQLMLERLGFLASGEDMKSKIAKVRAVDMQAEEQNRGQYNNGNYNCVQIASQVYPDLIWQHESKMQPAEGAEELVIVDSFLISPDQLPKAIRLPDREIKTLLPVAAHLYYSLFADFIKQG